jgi:Subtilase family
MNNWVRFLIIVFLMGCAGPNTQKPPASEVDFTASLLLDQNVSETAFENALGKVGSKYNVQFFLENFARLDSSNLPAGLCSSTLVRVNVTGANSDEALKYLGEAAAEVGSTDALADIDPRYGMGQADVSVTSSESQFAPQATSSLTGKGVRIAILDTGFGKSEIAFSQWSAFKSVIGQRNFTSADNEDYYDRYTLHEGLSYSYEGHGTPIAVLAGGSYGDFKGVAPEAEIMPIKVCSDDGKCLVSHVVQGICYALNNAPVDTNGQRRLSNLIINLSLGGDSPNKSLYEVLKFALENNVAVVTSAGNDGDGNSGTKDPIQYPAAFGVTLDGKDAVTEDGYEPLPGLIVVAALEQKNGSYAPASFSSQAPYVSLAAPGMDVKSGQAASVSFSDQFAGTSFATPQAAGALALLREGFPNIPLDSVADLDLKELLLNSAIPLTCTSCTPEMIGKGQLNVNTSPIIISEFAATSVYNGTATTLTWKIANVNNGGMECALDVQSDGTVDSTFSPCQETYSYDYLYPSFGTFKSTLSVRNGLGISTQRSIDVTVKSWSRQVSLSDRSEFVDVASNDKGNVYAVGNANASEYNTDAYVVKFDATGNEVWRYKFDSGDGDRAIAVASDATGVYVLGETAGTLGEEHSSYRPFSDIFLSKLSSQGEVLWTRQFGGNTSNYARDLAVGGRYKSYGAYIYVLSSMSSSDSVTGSGLYINVFFDDGTECFVTQPFPNFYGDGYGVEFTNEDPSYGYAKDRLRVVGHSSSSVDTDPDTTPGAFYLELYPVPPYCGSETEPITFDIVDALDLGSEGFSYATDVAVDKDGNAFITGTSLDQDSADGGDILVYKRDGSNPTRDWLLEIGLDNATASDIIVGASNYVYVAGTTEKSQYQAHGNLFLMKVAEDKTVVWQRRWVSSRPQEKFQANRLALVGNDVFVTGSAFYDPMTGQGQDTEEHGLILKVDGEGNLQ